MYVAKLYCLIVHYLGFDSSRQHVPDLATYFLNGLSYDKMSTVNLIELGKMHILVLDTVS
jgi:hypothetical protein